MECAYGDVRLRRTRGVWTALTLVTALTVLTSDLIDEIDLIGHLMSTRSILSDVNAVNLVNTVNAVKNAVAVRRRNTKGSYARCQRCLGRTGLLRLLQG